MFLPAKNEWQRPRKQEVWAKRPMHTLRPLRARWAAAKINLRQLTISLWWAATKKLVYRKHGKYLFELSSTRQVPVGTIGYPLSSTCTLL